MSLAPAKRCFLLFVVFVLCQLYFLDESVEMTWWEKESCLGRAQIISINFFNFVSSAPRLVLFAFESALLVTRRCLLS